MFDPGAVLSHLESHFQSHLSELIDFASIASVSTDPAFKAEMVRASDWVAVRLARAGVPVVEILKTPGHPVVYAEWLSVPGAPTILIYGHYDVQPADPLEKWYSAPFEPEVRLVDHEERLYARGVSDDKGPMLIPILVAEAFAQTSGRPPVNLKFLLEGEEEVGSQHLEALVRERGDVARGCFLAQHLESRSGKPRVSPDRSAQGPAFGSSRWRYSKPAQRYDKTCLEPA